MIKNILETMKKMISMTLVALMMVFTMTGCKKNHIITVISNNDAWGTVTGSGTYKERETVEIAAVPAEGYYFICWNDGDETNPRQIVVLGTAVYIATFSDTPGGGNDTPEIIHNAVTDIDGNHYDAVKIGDQVWIAQNLRTTHYADGTAIPAGGDNYSDTDPYFYVTPGLDASVYGYYYNWPAAMHGAASSNTVPSGVQGVCPNGWHLPSDAEWSQLTDYVVSQSEYTCGGNSESIAKALASTEFWSPSTSSCSPGYDSSTNNATGFGVVPAGTWYFGFHDAGNIAGVWSSTENTSYRAWYRYLDYGSAYVGRYGGSRDGGFSVRCLRD